LWKERLLGRRETKEVCVVSAVVYKRKRGGSLIWRAGVFNKRRAGCHGPLLLRGEKPHARSDGYNRTTTET